MTDLYAHAHPIPAVFVGREEALSDLDQWLASSRSTRVIHAIGGMGKSTLARLWVERNVSSARQYSDESDRSRNAIFWWSFYEQDAGFRNFAVKLSSWLAHLQPELGAPSADDPEALFERLREHHHLLVLDGFERELRAFATGSRAGQATGSNECTDPLAAELLHILSTKQMSSHVLITSRVVPAELGSKSDNVDLYALEGLSDQEVIAFFRAKNVIGSDDDLIAVSARYGHHPLALQLLAGRIKASGSADIGSARGWDASLSLKSKTSHILYYSTQSLSGDEAYLLRLLCASPDSLSAALAKAATHDKIDFEQQLRNLEHRGLASISADFVNIHPVVRLYVAKEFGIDAEKHAQIAASLIDANSSGANRAVTDLNVMLRLSYHLSRANSLQDALVFLKSSYQLKFFFDAEYEEIIAATDGFVEDGKLEKFLPDIPDRTYLLSIRAGCFEKLGDFAYARSIFEDVLIRDYKGGNIFNVGITSLNLARTLVLLGDLDRADEIYNNIPEQALAEGQIQARVFLFRGFLKGVIGDISGLDDTVEATRFFDFQHANAQTAQSAQALAVAFAYVAETLLELNKPGDALGFAARAVSLATASGSKREFARSSVIFIACRLKNGEMDDDIIQDIDKTLVLTRTTRQPEFEIQALLVKADMLTLSGNLFEASRVALEALRKCVRASLTLKKIESHLQLARLHAQIHRLEDAEFHLCKAMELLGTDARLTPKRLLAMAENVSIELEAATTLTGQT